MSYEQDVPTLFIHEDAISLSTGALRLVFGIDREHGTGAPTGMLYVSVSAHWMDHGERLANYTPVYESGEARYLPEEVIVTDQGQLRAMHRARPFGAVDIRTGITVDLPASFITPVRQALATLQVELEGMAESP